jgi:hypothetical protein
VRELQAWIDEHVKVSVADDADPMLFPSSSVREDRSGRIGPGGSMGSPED